MTIHRTVFEECPEFTTSERTDHWSPGSGQRLMTRRVPTYVSFCGRFMNHIVDPKLGLGS